MDVIRAPLDLLAQHLYVGVFLASLVDAAGIPCPGRIVLVVAGTLAATTGEVSAVIAVAVAGALVGDHALYVAGKTQGPRLLTTYCRLTRSEPDCVDNAVRYFRRFGSSAVAMGRFSMSVRLFAAVLAGCGHMTYPRFLAFDAAGTAVYASLWALVGYVFGEAIVATVSRMGPARFLVLVIPLTLLSITLYRLWQRRYAAVPTPLVVTPPPPAAAATPEPASGLVTPVATRVGSET